MPLTKLHKDYQAKAEELKAIADSDVSGQRAKTLRALAEDYELLARAAEAIEKSYRRLSMG